MQIEKKIYDVNSFPYDRIIDMEVVTGKNAITFFNVPATFDIETTSIVKYKEENGNRVIDMDKTYGFMYHWQFCLNGYVIFGRTWKEFIKFIDRISLTLFLSKGRRLVVYCHNLAFEFQFIKDFFNWTSVFAREKRKPMKAVTDCGLEFRCSYFLSNMSLKAFCDSIPNVKYGKKDGDLDYSLIRTPSTVLTKKEQEYCFNDVAGLAECIEHKINEDGDITKIPLTSTGYVRREFRQAMQKNPNNRKDFLKMKLSLDEYNMCRREFRGGDTHCSVYYSAELLSDVHSYDITSSYIYCMFAMKYPMSKFIKVIPRSVEEFEEYISEYACLFDITFKNVRVKEVGAMPYIPASKCFNLGRNIADNGRIISADKLSMTLTDIDYRIIEKEYYFSSIEIGNMRIAKYDLLSPEFRTKLLEYFRLKSELKHVDDYFYMKSKNKLNSSFGMMVTDIVRPEISFEDNKWIEKVVDMEKQLKAYYNSRNSFLSYQHGIWTTSNARYRLRESIWGTGIDTVYVDTDSNKHIGDHRDTFRRLNDDVYKRIEELDIKPIIKVNGEEFVCGIWEYEGRYDKFVSMGAKKYCWEKNDKLQITVSGLNKRIGSEALKNKGGIKAFKEGTFFDVNESGRKVSCYHDTGIHSININGETIESASNIGLAPTSYLLGITDDYKEVIRKFTKR